MVLSHNQLDSLKKCYSKKIKNCPEPCTGDTTAIRLLIEIGDAFRQVSNDSAMYFYDKALNYSGLTIEKYQVTGNKTTGPFISLKAVSLNKCGNIYKEKGHLNKAEELYLQSLKIYESTVNRAEMAKNYILLGSLYQIQDYFNKATENFFKALKIYEEAGDNKEMASCYTNIGIVYTKQGLYDKALDYYLKSLKISEETGDTKKINSCYNSIGLLHREYKQFDKAMNYFKKSLKMGEETGDRWNQAVACMNIGTINHSLSNFDTAVIFYNKALKIFEEIGKKPTIARCYGNIAITYKAQNKFDIAKKYFDESLKVFMEYNDKDGIANVYSNLAEISLYRKSYADALDYAFRGLKIAKEINSYPRERDLYQNLSAAYDSMNNPAKALMYYKLFKQLNDSIFNLESSRQLKRTEAIYQSEKQQKEIELLNKNKKLQEVEIKRQTIQKYAFLAGFSLMLILAFVIFASNKKIKAQRNVIQEKNEELFQQNAEISAQRDFIEHIHEELTDSIKYAEKIQQALLPADNYISSLIRANINNDKTSIEDFFILYKPRDIVSGDFYFFEKRNNSYFFAVADCTGHGVPGAFMSMLGISFIQEIIRKEDVTQANHVLNNLRNKIIDSLKQKDEYLRTDESRTDHNSEPLDVKDMPSLASPASAVNTSAALSVKDGMDIAFCIFNTETGMLHFAGANNPLYVVKNNKSEPTGYSLEEIKPDKMPVAVHIKIAPFTNHEIQLEKGNRLYMFSDGLPDQFGGGKGKKFKYSAFKELLVNISDYSMNDQKKNIDSELNSWMFGYDTKHEQLDDITVMGIKI